MYTLRNYQKESVEKAKEYINSGNDKPQIIVSPVGSGKSLIIAGLANELDCTIVVLQKTKELLVQNYNKYTSFGNSASIYSASLGTKELGKVTFATPKSIAKIGKNLKNKVDLLIVDECHLQTKKKSVISKFIKEIGVKKVIGLTATPIEMKKSLYTGVYLAMINRSRSNMFSQILHVTQVKDIKDSFWTKMVYYQKNMDNSMLKLNSTGSDYTKESMTDFFNFNQLIGKIEDDVTRLLNGGRKSILIFAPTIDQANMLSKKIKNSKCVSSKTKTKERDSIIKGFKNLEIPVVINVGVLSVGFDHPQLDTIIVARPTNSFVVHYQILGRGVRQHPQKEDCVIIDYTPNISKFGILEDITFREGSRGWGMFSGDKQLTLHDVDARLKRYPDGSVIMPFGKYKNMSIDEVPISYLNWCLSEWTFNNKFLKDLKVEMEKVVNNPFILCG